MNTGTLIAGIAIAALFAGGASATVHKKVRASRAASESTYASPAQPIPYAQLDAYLHASSGQRAAMDVSAPESTAMGGGMPAPGSSDTSASQPMSGGGPASAPPMSPPEDSSTTPPK